MIETIALILTAGAAAAPGAGPSGAPTAQPVTTYGVSPEFWRVNWINGDPTAYTRVHVADLFDPFGSSVFIGSKNPGDTSFDTFIEFSVLIGDQKTFYIYHRKNGQDSAEVSVNTV